MATAADSMMARKKGVPRPAVATATTNRKTSDSANRAHSGSTRGVSPMSQHPDSRGG